ncbi:hypothetical protein [Lactiplantibacillus pentosus]|uniref:hypothetical protein n=1 Tax=Lactiplantibacillus pentosus TaxID=1589 RepID=UPI001CFFD4F9|nr:hypothetical protein [Lactiplantibacillus pentosus]MCB5222477.1 hypothetical protein [Lactiplantibacillus pentosus]
MSIVRRAGQSGNRWMADERPPNLVQLTTEYEVAGPSRKGLNSIDDGLWYLITEKIT